MPQMAAGGLVAFAPGGSVEGDASRARTLARLAKYGITNQDEWQRLAPEVRDRITRAVNAARKAETGGAIAGLFAAEINDLLADPFKAIGNLGIAASNTGPGVAAGLSDPRQPNEPFQYNANRQQMLGIMDENMLSAEDAISSLPAGPAQTLPEDFDISTLMRAPGARNIPTMAGIGALPTEPKIPRGPGQSISAPALGDAPPPTDEAAPTGGAGAGGGGGLPSLGGGGADAAMQRGFEVADQYTGRAEKAGRYTGMEAELRALDAAQYDPAQERRDEMSAFLAGTANTTNFGSTMAGGTLASLNLRRKQQSERRERLKDVFDITERGMTLDTTLANGGLQLGQQMYGEAMANQRAALSAATSMSNAELQANLKRADMEYNKLKDDKSFNLKERELTIQEARNVAIDAATKAEDDTRRFGAVSMALDRIQDQEASVRKHVVENSQIPGLQGQLGYESDPEKIQALRAAIAVEEASALVRAEQILDKMGVVEARDLLAAELLSFTGTGAGELSLEDIAGTKKLGGE